MLALAGYPLGMRFRFLDPSPNSPAGQLAEHITASYDDRIALERFAAGLDVVTYEFENVPDEAARYLSARLPVCPPPGALTVSQDRLTEKTFCREHGIPTPDFVPVSTLDELRAGLERVGLPAVLKTRRFGYDGKGQAVVRSAGEAEGAWRALGAGERALILEAFVAFRRELSVLAVRGRGGETAFYPLVENHHREGILRLSVAPAPGLTPELQALAEGYAGRALDALGYVGVLAIELFEVDGGLMANEMAPRVHNSGHWTIEGAETSQFENHLRAVVGLPLGPTVCIGHSAMVNVIGTLPDPAAVLAVEGAHLHQYGKEPRAGRKLGHVTVRGDEPARVMERARVVMGAVGE
jgi:5-(carboxyamino)imidazole ribonucleotide synthase